MKLAPDFGIVGYTDRWTYRPGEMVSLHLSAERQSTATVRLHRFRQLVPDGLGLELLSEPVAAAALEVAVRPQPTRLGSWFEAALPNDVADDDGFTLAFLALPTAIAEAGNGLCSLADERSGFALALSGRGDLEVRCRCRNAAVVSLWLPDALPQGQWSAVAITHDRRAALLTVTVRCNGRTVSATDQVVLPLLTRNVPLRLATCHDGFAGELPSFNGRLEAPALWNWPLPHDDAFRRLDLLAAGSIDDDPALVAAWDFSRRIDSEIGVDAGPRGAHGRFVNLPTRAVKGVHWSGGEQSWVHAPRDYASVHFHQDDLADAGWPQAAALSLPDTLDSGLYLIEVAGEAGRDTLPIFVRPRRPDPDRLAFLASTFTYLAYANDRCLLHGANPEVLAGRLIVLTAADSELAAHPEYGLSLYDTHADGSGVAYASRRRPCLTFRHTQRAWQGALGCGLWNFGADLLILSWLERQGMAYDIVTDDDLDARGGDALSPYRCVMTGSHPEYHTTRSHDAIRRFLETGGRFVYTGGNGFYWRVSTHPDCPETIELRRAEDGNRSWAAEPGEYYHAFDGAYGGLWRRNGRPPQALVGVGYTGQGFFKCHPYRLLAAAGDPRIAFLFDAAPEPGAALGAFGLSGGGAAGIEIDRADRLLGTPGHALVIATADAMHDSYVLANEEVLVNRPTVIGRLSPMLRADLVFFETPAGGAVLSTGSVAWAGSLGDPRGNNDVARLTGRAVARFLDPAPFTMPPRCGQG